MPLVLKETPANVPVKFSHLVVPDEGDEIYLNPTWSTETLTLKGEIVADSHHCLESVHDGENLVMTDGVIFLSRYTYLEQVDPHIGDYPAVVKKGGEPPSATREEILSVIQRVIDRSIPYVAKHGAYLIPYKEWEDLVALVCPETRLLDTLFDKLRKGEKPTEEEIQEALTWD